MAACVITMTTSPSLCNYPVTGDKKELSTYSRVTNLCWADNLTIPRLFPSPLRINVAAVKCQGQFRAATSVHLRPLCGKYIDPFCGLAPLSFSFFAFRLLLLLYSLSSVFALRAHFGESHENKMRHDRRLQVWYRVLSLLFCLISPSVDTYLLSWNFTHAWKNKKNRFFLFKIKYAEMKFQNVR